jgi:hypothetical protein
MNKSKNNFRPSSKITLLALVTACMAASPAMAVKWHAPIVVNKAYLKKHGSIISGDFQGTLTQAAITIVTSDPIQIVDSNLEGPGDLIQAIVVPANISVYNTSGVGTNPNVKGVQKGIFLHVNQALNIVMNNNYISGMRQGLYINGYVGNHTHTNTINVLENVFSNVDGRPSNGANDYAGTGQYNGQAIHINNVCNTADMQIAWNEIINAARESATGAVFEFSNTGGISTSHMLVHDNYIQGSFPAAPGAPGILDLYQFGAITLDGGPNDTVRNATAFVDVFNNQVVATANYGIALAAGHDNTIKNNRVVSSGFLSNGVFYAMSSYGNAYGAYNTNVYNQPASVFFNNNITNNVLGLIKNDGSGNPVRSDWSLAGQGGAIEGNTDFLPNDNADPTVHDEAVELANWNAKLHLQHKVIGLKNKSHVKS